jgi:hypothetical protein
MPRPTTQWSWLTFVAHVVLRTSKAQSWSGCQMYIYQQLESHHKRYPQLTTLNPASYHPSHHQLTKYFGRYFRYPLPTNMLFTRLLSIILRTAQWVFAAIVLGLSAYFVYQRSRHNVGPFGRLIFTLIWSSLSVLVAVIWAIPTSSSITGYTSDLSELSSVLRCHTNAY